MIISHICLLPMVLKVGDVVDRGFDDWCFFLPARVTSVSPDGTTASILYLDGSSSSEDGVAADELRDSAAAASDESHRLLTSALSSIMDSGGVAASFALYRLSEGWRAWGLADETFIREELSRQMREAGVEEEARRHVARDASLEESRLKTALSKGPKWMKTSFAFPRRRIFILRWMKMLRCLKYSNSN